MVTSQMRLYDVVTFGIERNRADGRPVSSVARPARRVEFSRPEVQGMSGSENRMIVTGVALSRADVTNAAVALPVDLQSSFGLRPLRLTGL